jgi:Flp pilus assembly protein TadG
MRRHSERGSTLPEMAIAAIAVLSFLFGIIDFGRALYTYEYVGQLARQGARWAIVRGADSCANSNSQLSNCGNITGGIQTYVQSLSEGATTAGNITATAAYGTSTTCATASNAPGCTVAVTVTYPFHFVMGPLMPKATITMSSTSEMVISQ